MHLRPCPGCLRHVRSNETRCPFCEGVLAAEPSRTVPNRRLGRAASVALGAAMVVVGCEEQKPASDPSQADVGTSVIANPPPVAEDASEPGEETEPMQPPPNMKKPYGAPPADGFFV